MRFGLEQEKMHLGLFFLTLLIPPVLYLARNLDDNRLTSWSWVFAAVDPGRLFLVLVAIAPFLWLLSRSSLPPVRQPLIPALTAFGLSLLFLDVPEVIVDASRYFVQAKFYREQGPLWFFQEWGRGIFVWTDLPLMPWLYGLLFTLFGEVRLAAQLGNSALFALAVYLVCLLGRDLWDEETGILAGFLLLGFPFLYTQVPLLLVDVATMTFLLLAMVTWHRALTRGGGFRLLLAGVALAAAFLVKYSAWLLLTGLVPLFVLAAMADPRRALRRGLLATLPALFLLSLVLAAHWEVMAAQLELLAVYQKPGLKRWSESLVSTFLFQTHPLLTAGALYAGFLAWTRRDGRFLAVVFLLVLLLGILEVRRIRYALPVFPLVALAAAYGFRGVADRQVRRHLVLAVVVPSLLLAWGAFRPFLQDMGEGNLQEAGAYLDRLEIARATVFLLAAPEPVLDPRVSVPLLDIFTTRQLDYFPLLSAEEERSGWAVASPLRFTWEFPLPPFYFQGEGKAPEAVVVISDTPQPKLPSTVVDLLALLPEKREFSRTSEVFLHRTFVAVYHRAAVLP